ncbi:MAG: hypothetical protein IPM82_28430 [Saprospiraceae bacterium]|nr:hypothetical protein [Saprospiraceae bacterium]
MDFIDFHSGFQRDVVGISAPKDEINELMNLFASLKDNGALYKAFVLANSPRCLIYRNTSIRVNDIYDLPVMNQSSKNMYTLTKIDNLIIRDINSTIQDSISNPNSAKAYKSISSKNLLIHLVNYSELFCYSLNSIYQKHENRFHAVDAGTLHNNNFLYVAFRYDDKPDFTFSEESEELPIASEEKLQELLTLDKGYAKFSRILKIYKKDYVCFIKPNQLRYWLDSVALRDADWVLDDLVKNGH